MIRQWILPALTFSAHGRPSAVEPVELVEVILYKHKTTGNWLEVKGLAVQGQLIEIDMEAHKAR